MSKIGYARVSSEDQNLERQINALKEVGVDKIFQEKISGKNEKEREEFNKAMNYLRSGDVFIVDSLERLGRNYDDIIRNIQKLDQEEIGLNVLNMPVLNQDFGDPLLQKLIRNIIIQVLSWMAENERLESRRKQMQGIKIAKKQGKYKGRKPLFQSKDEPRLQHAFELYKSKRTLSEVEELTGINKETFRRYVKKYNITR